MSTHSVVDHRTWQPTATEIRQAFKQRGIEATRRLREVLHLSVDGVDTDLLGTVLAEVAAEETGRNSSFADEIRRRYDEAMGQRTMAAKRTQRKTTSRNSQPTLPPLVPIRRIEGGYALDPAAPPNPQHLIELYGRDQLARALQEYLRDTLKQTAAEIERTHPGTKPKNRANKDALIDYIVEHS